MNRQDTTDAKRERTDDVFTLGFVGRVTPEKGVRFLKNIEDHFRANGVEEAGMVADKPAQPDSDPQGLVHCAVFHLFVAGSTAVEKVAT